MCICLRLRRAAFVRANARAAFRNPEDSFCSIGGKQLLMTVEQQTAVCCPVFIELPVPFWMISSSSNDDRNCLLLPASSWSMISLNNLKCWNNPRLMVQSCYAGGQNAQCQNIFKKRSKEWLKCDVTVTSLLAIAVSCVGLQGGSGVCSAQSVKLEGRHFSLSSLFQSCG